MGLKKMSLVAERPVASATTSDPDSAGTPPPTTTSSSTGRSAAASLASGVPAVPGTRSPRSQADHVLWMVYGFPADLTLNHALILGADGVASHSG